MIKLAWEKTKGAYAYGSSCFAGPFIVGETFQPTQSKGYTGPRWKPTVSLPGVRVKDGLMYETEEEAKDCVERVIQSWFGKVSHV